MTEIMKKMQEVQIGTQNVLVSLTNFQEGEQKRLPYSVLRSFETIIKQLKSLKSEVSS